MTVIEPESVYECRKTTPQRITKPPCELESAIMEAIRSKEYPPLFMSVVTSVASNRDFRSRSDREHFKVEAIRIIGRMIRCGTLVRVKRKLVSLPGRSFGRQARYTGPEGG